MDSARFLHQQKVERYRKLLEHATDVVQRRQIVNLLDEAQEHAGDLRIRIERPEAA
jgi:hypothetical protein